MGSCEASTNCIRVSQAPTCQEPTSGLRLGTSGESWAENAPRQDGPWSCPDIHALTFLIGRDGFLGPSNVTPGGEANKHSCSLIGMSRQTMPHTHTHQNGMKDLLHNETFWEKQSRHTALSGIVTAPLPKDCDCRAWAGQNLHGFGPSSAALPGT